MPLPKFLQPDKIAKLGKVAVVAQRTVEGMFAGLHKSPYHGFSVEFAEHRKYTAGDPIRFIDWRVVARTERYYIKLYEDETNLKCHMLLDTSGSMGYKRGADITKLEYACYLAGALSYLLVKQSDSVGLTCFHESLADYIAPAGSAPHLRKLLEHLEGLRAGKETRIANTFHTVAERIKRRSLVVVFSDMYENTDELTRAMRHFSKKRHEVWLFHIVDPAEVDFPFDRTARFKDMETGELLQVDPNRVRAGYRKAFTEFSSKIRSTAESTGSRYVLARTDAPYEQLLGAFLRRRR